MFAGRPVVVAFLSPGCTQCVQLVRHLNRMATVRQDVPCIVVVTGTGASEFAATLGERLLVVSDEQAKLQKAYAVEWVPTIYLIDDEGKVAMRSIANDLLDLEDTIDGIGRRQGNAPFVPVGPDE